MEQLKTWKFTWKAGPTWKEVKAQLRFTVKEARAYAEGLRMGGARDVVFEEVA